MAYSQLTQPCVGGQPIAYDDCSAACAVCDITVLNGVTFNSGAWTPDHVNELNYTCNGVNIVMNNNGWVGFVANSNTLELKVVYSNCTGGNAGVGMQALIVESPDCQNFNLLACKGDATPATTDSFTLVANNLVVGQSYYLVLDGFSGSVCDLSVEVLNNAGGPPIVGPGTVSGPTHVCPGDAIDYTFGPADNGSLSDWQLPPGATLLSGGDPATVPIDPLAPTTVTVVFGPNPVSGDICVTPYNGCSTGNPSCISVVAEPIPDTYLPDDTICYGETYVGIDGNSYTNNNTASSYTTYPIQVTEGGGPTGFCDSTVYITMIYLPSLVTNAPTLHACQGDTVYVGNTMVLSDQQITAVGTSVNGCDSTINVFVDFIDNDASANGPLSISCTNNAQLVGSGTTNTGTYAWYDPSDNQISTSLTASALVGGQHYFVVTNTENGFTCTDTAFVNVTANFSLPQNVTASAAGQIGCGANSSTQLTGSTTTANASFEWLDPSNSQISTTTTATATQTGTYQFIVTNPSSGCKDTVDVPVTADASIPDLTGTGGIIDCNISTATISATSTTSGLNYSWSGPGAYTSLSSSDVVSVPGSYSVTVTDPSNGCTNSTGVIVADSTTPPSIVTMGNIVGCNASGVSITASSNTGISYSWTGPNGYLSNIQNPNDIIDPGNYTVVVTNANGCTNSDVAVVGSDSATPTVSPTGGTISCLNPTVQIQANSNPNTDVTYSWTGPSGAQTSPDFITGSPGLYEVTVTNTLNGCTETGLINIPADTVAPLLTLTADDNLIDCNNVDVVLTATSNGVSYAWSGGITGTSPTVTVTQQGNYTVDVTGANGCVTTESINIQEDTAQPDIATSDVDITCTDTSPTITATSTVGTTSFSWTGPNGFTANSATASITDGGQYFVTVTNTANGCTNTTSLMANNLITVPTLTTTNDSLGCGASATAQLTATSTNGSTFSWTGPGSFSGTGSSVSVPATGVYTVVVTDLSGCTNTATAEVFPDTNLPELTVVSDGTLDCSLTSTTTLSASSTTTGVNASDFEWTGPSGSTTGSSVSVSTFDAYTVVVTAPNGCTNSATLTADADTISPVLTGLVASNDLDCSMPSATLSATTNATSYSWTGPNGFSDNNTTASITDGGVYTLVVTGANKCTATQDVTVLQDTISPDVAVADASLDCIASSATLVATSNSTISGYSWSGPSGFTGNTSTVNVMNDGIYTVVVTSANGCTNSTDAVVSANQNAPNVSAVGGTITCLTTSIDLMGNSSTPNATGVWTLNNVTVANDFPLVVSDTGSYILTVTAPNGCVSDTTVIVDNDIVLPVADATAATPLSCTTTSVSIEGNSNVSTATYSWTGPNGFTSTMQNPNNVTDQGLYTLTVTNPSTGCTNTDTVTVFLNADLPDLAASVDNATLDCNTTSVNLTSSSTTSGVTYNWVGPGISASPTDQDQNVSIPGNYTITVVAPNGCVHDTTIVIQIDTISPQNVVATGGVILCGTSDITLSGNSSTSGVAYTWVGPGNVPYTGQNPVVDEVGIYTLTVENLANGCTATDTTNVAEDINAPNATVSVNGTITCTNTTVEISGESTTPNVTYAWTTPTNATLSGKGPHVVSDYGSYKLVVTAPNGCSTVKNIAAPVDTISPGASTMPITLTCQNPSGTLIGSTNSANTVSYDWTGPNGYTNNNASATGIVDDGAYTLVVTDDVNGCSSMTSVTVVSDQANPDAFANDAVIDCNTPSLQINAGSATAGVTFSWTGPNGFTSTDTMPTVTVGGQYTLTVLDASTGCTSVAVAQIDEDKTPPNVSIDPSPLLITCAMPNVTLLGSSLTTGVTFEWTGPNSFTSTNPSPSITDPGLYTLKVTGSNGCTDTATKNVDKDSDFPVLATQVNGTLTCAINSVDIEVSETTGKTMTYIWSGPGSFSSTDAKPSVSLPGTYMVEGTAANGCKVTSQAVVDINDTKPTAVAGGGFEIDCVILEGTLNADGSSTGSNISYQWSTAQGHIVKDGDTANPLVDGPGTYELTVTDAVNGCTNTTSVVVTADPAIPNDLNVRLRQIACYGDNDGAVSIQGVIGGTAPFQYSFDGGPFTSDVTYTNLGPGDYPITIIDANGCKLNTGVSIVEPKLFTIDLGPDQMVEYGSVVKVDAQVDDTKRVEVVGWNTFLDSTCLFTNPMECYEQQFVAEKTTTFEVAATDTSGCDATDRMTVFVAKPQNVYFPNIFSPNGDNYNDLYLASTGKGVALIKVFSIYDRWGNLMMELSDIQPGQNLLLWDGRFRDKPALPGVYIYRAEVLFLNGDRDTYVGDITLIR